MEPDEMDMASPTDSLLEHKKKKRMMEVGQQEKAIKVQSSIGVNDCDLGASPTLNKNML
eukprot:CAMPEP_0170556832 /NCGR_PEP_ID=MMETSP0211-20121228/18929_1 /TAXON_ID=311385 /ORGANISM="Pseudokeronopsis sp., Strain OXSARD2" /LENGTH=58 /DNA_ID=CAMNT_0010867401 /DNA_START=246 /DNA_END=418 /DNA_ORIENTATION=+